MKQEQFLTIIDKTPLVSVDLIMIDVAGKVLLGRRCNRPAQGFWFVPGGRIKKNETIDQAIQRVAQAEMGICLGQSDVHLLGAFDHIYTDNAFNMEGINTHYVTLGYECRLNKVPEVCADTQHSVLRWWTVEDLLASDEVHENTRRYFTSGKIPVTGKHGCDKPGGIGNQSGL